MNRSAVQLALCLSALMAQADERLDFRTRILPILTKAGCNSGSCHGAAVGQGGFKLSLLGYDPEYDHVNLTREAGGRRVDDDTASRSLFLRKGTDELDHEGGRKIKAGSELYQTLLSWVKAGTPYGPADLQVTSINVEPADTLLPAAAQTVQLKVMATLSDGTKEDVTTLALFSSNDDAVADVDKTGLVTTQDQGLTSIMVRYSGQAVAARIAVPFGSNMEPSDGFTPVNFMDESVITELRRMGLPASPLSDDAEFLRRVHLDLTGRLPEPEVVREFMTRPASAAKRDALIHSLLESNAFVDFWTMQFGDWLLIRGGRGNEDSSQIFHAWVRDQILHNRPLDQFVSELLLASGSVAQNGPVNFFNLAADPRDLSEHVGSMFLGAQIACARCHAHPADRWTQGDYHAFAAFFARVGRQGNELVLKDSGEVLHPKTQKPAMPRPLGAAADSMPTAADRRIALVDWLVAPENPFFARNLVNRIWKHLIGRGIVEPVDDLRPTNPPTNPALLDALATRFTKHHFDLRWLVGEIARSRVYQLTSRAVPGNQRDDSLFSHATLKPLTAQVFADAVAQATGVPDQYENHETGTRAVQLASVSTASYALDVLGRCGRERSCETMGRTGGGLAQSLHLINGTTINAKLSGGVLAKLLNDGVSNHALIEELYLRTLSRLPRVEEREAWTRLLSSHPARAQAAEDLLWALLNSREFAFNH